MSRTRPTVGITMGDPAGIGPEIIANAYDAASDVARPVVLGDARVMETAVDLVGADLELKAIPAVEEAAFEEGVLDVVDFGNVGDLTFGAITGEYGRASIEYVEHVIECALDGRVDAIANGPINKEAMSLAGSDYAGHTNLLADRTGTERYAMFNVADEFVVSQVTAHVPLVEACELVTTERVLETVRVTEVGMESLGVTDPTIAVAGLNPHAGEGGVLGTEDSEEIEPAVERAREEGTDAHGPLPSDSLYNQAIAGHYDAVVAMYHDQGHIPLFVQEYVEGGGVGGAGMTAGLPFVRTTTVHGTGHDIAGENVATPASMIDAIRVAARGGRHHPPSA